MRIINTPAAVLIGIVYGYLPLMVLPIYVSLEKLDRRLLEASADLGAKPWRTFLQVTLPLSLPGVATGSMLVFILLMGEFIIPALLGGGKVFFIGNALVDLFLQSRNWPFGAAVSVALVVVMLVTVVVYMRFVLGRGGDAPRGAGLRAGDARLRSPDLRLPLPPIALIVFFSFNAGRYAMDWQGFSVEWYGKAFANPFAVKALLDEPHRSRSGRRCSRRMIGTLAALGLERMHGGCAKDLRRPRLRRHHGAGRRHRHRDADRLRHRVRCGQSRAGRRCSARRRRSSRWAWPRSSPRMCCSTWRVVILIVRARLAGMDRSLIEASEDLYATPFATFRQVTLPQLMPAIVAGFLLCLHLQLRRFHHRLLRRRPEQHAADLRLRLDPPRRHAGDQRHRHGRADGFADAASDRAADPETGQWRREKSGWLALDPR